MDEKSGEVRLGSVLDADTVSSYSLTIQVKDGGFPSQTSTTSLVINVEDVNDHHPRFNSETGYETSLPEQLTSANASGILTLKLVIIIFLIIIYNFI